MKLLISILQPADTSTLQNTSIHFHDETEAVERCYPVSKLGLEDNMHLIRNTFASTMTTYPVTLSM